MNNGWFGYGPSKLWKKTTITEIDTWITSIRIHKPTHDTVLSIANKLRNNTLGHCSTLKFYPHEISKISKFVIGLCRVNQRYVQKQSTSDTLQTLSCIHVICKIISLQWPVCWMYQVRQLYVHCSPDAHTCSSVTWHYSAFCPSSFSWPVGLQAAQWPVALLYLCCK